MSLSADEQQAVADALRAEHAAVYAYGLVDAYAAPQRSAAINEAAAAHRARRDATTSLLRSNGVAPPAAEAGYVIPLPVTDPTTAVALAAEIESETAVVWRSLLERSAPQSANATTGLRSTAVDALADCAVRGAGWRAVLGQSPPTTPFPGQP